MYGSNMHPQTFSVYHGKACFSMCNTAKLRIMLMEHCKASLGLRFNIVMLSRQFFHKNKTQNTVLRRVVPVEYIGIEVHGYCSRLQDDWPIVVYRLYMVTKAMCIVMVECLLPACFKRNITEIRC